MFSRVLHVLLGTLCSLLAVPAAAEDSPSLPARIDSLVEATAVGPLAPLAGDADFLRRVSIDLIGTIPTAAEARAFFADSSPDKRNQLIDRLLDSPSFARHMALTFDVMLMERRPDKAVKSTEWQAWLYQSFLTNKPLDQLCRELISADGAEPAVRPASRFLIDRECEPNAVTRDAGRLLFGMDLQCAQCHDHPTVDDYLQEDYYGLYAFFHRSSLFTDTKSKMTLVAEKADGEANFKSVFTDNSADRVSPRLPHGPFAAAEPVFAKGEEYVSAPAKDVRAIPKHSRRAQLAAMLTSTPQFRRNLANRVWAHLFGRGIVHPVDAHHAANPPTHPEVLNLLADEVGRTNYDLKQILRPILQTRAYQRSCDPPRAAEIAALDPAGIKALIASLESERPSAEQRLKEHETDLAQLTQDLRKTRGEALNQQQAVIPLVAEAKTAQEELAKAQMSLAALQESVFTKEPQAVALAEAVAKAQEAAKLLGDDKTVVEATAALASRARSLKSEVEAARKSLDDLKKQLEVATVRQKAASEALAAAQQSAIGDKKLMELERKMLERHEQTQADRFSLATIDARLAQAKAILTWQQAEMSQSPAASQAWSTMIDGWTNNAQLARLRQLSCEQFALSLAQASGIAEQRAQAVREALEKTPPPELKDAAEADQSRILARLVEEQTFDKLLSTLNAFTSLYATQFAEEFQATVNQALFFENGSAVQSLIGPSGGNLAHRLVKIESPQEVADELYLSTLTRFPTEEERNDVAEHLKARAADRAVAIGEIVWALLSSNEFRFNH
ncbi:hypothetical protein Spb1_24430 [Planctopirus ephydatiae]|uniref:Chromosome partition protein Smc n=1 Tax=Planctopirus ephydatiae TaxID=2528019 RepID=A0A518GPP2_9PLAN|nr:DUF1549 domain-containing protein [Planctopirus ephydatiae]QDV30509.1 hypothetical protein Spb1_24430 [Planctopirus ephydatiae]